MAKIELYIPAMGEGIIEATITKWFKKEGDHVNHDESVVEIATDKVDSEIPSPESGIIEKILFEEGKVVKVGGVIAIINTGEGGKPPIVDPDIQVEELKVDKAGLEKIEKNSVSEPEITEVPFTSTGIFLSPLVKSIISKEKITEKELVRIKGTGLNARITKDDILAFLKTRDQNEVKPEETKPEPKEKPIILVEEVSFRATPNISDVRIIEMNRLRRLTAEHTLRSKQISPHVTSFLEADVTHIVKWRNSVKELVKQKYSENITFTPIFVEATVKALKDHPLINVSVEGNNILVKSYINIGLATSLPSGNLIVPVIKNADNKSLLELTKSVNDLAKRARENRLFPDDIMGGTFTITNLGTFGVMSGTPIINQPEVAILGLGVIKKQPVVRETEDGDVIAIRSIVMLSLSFDHRVVDGYAAGVFLVKIKEYLESFDPERKI